MKDLPKGYVDAVITDPPYGIGERTMRATNGRGKSVAGGFKYVSSRDWPAVYGDDRPFDPLPFLSFKKVVLWGANHYCERLPGRSHWLIWDKREKTGSDDNADCEIAWTNLPGPARIHRQLWRGICKRGEENISRGPQMLHPTQKPERLMRWCIDQAKMPETILDPFLGSGTTAVAALKLGRHFLGFEISEEYCRIARERIVLAQAQGNLFDRAEKMAQQCRLYDGPDKQGALAGELDCLVELEMLKEKDGRL